MEAAMSKVQNNDAAGEGTSQVDLGKFLVFIETVLETVLRSPSKGADKQPMVENGTDTDGNIKYCLPKGPTQTGLDAMKGLAETLKRKMRLTYNGAQKVTWVVSGKTVHEGSRHHLDIILKAIYAWEEIVHGAELPDWPKATKQSTQTKVDAAKAKLRAEHDAELEKIKQQLISHGIPEDEAEEMVRGSKNPVTTT
jgi:hypothetical protein